MEKVVCRAAFLVFFLFYFHQLQAQENLLKRKLSLNIQEESIDSILMEISSKADFTFSYNSALFSQEKQSVQEENKTVKAILSRIMPYDVEYKVFGNHLVLLKKGDAHKEEIKISGRVLSQLGGEALENIVVFEINSLVSDLSDKNGEFDLVIPVKSKQLALSFSQNAFEDTLILLQAKDQELTVALSALGSLEKIPARSFHTLNSHSLVKHFVPASMLDRISNTDIVQKKLFQLSFLPTLGSNLLMSGLVRNQFSLNILAGYSYAVDAFEMGGLLNITHTDVSGFQIAGLGNLVGENTAGVQLAGLFNHNNGSLKGFQLAGISNKLMDSLHGIQIGGISNLLRGGMTGVQIAGINNLTTENVNGIQIAGISNISRQNVKSLQLAGLFNYGKNVEGLQFSGLINYAVEDVNGLQFAGLLNKANRVSSYQIAGFGNISTDSVLGNQISGVINLAKYTEGGQLALFNFCDSSSGTPIGLFSFVRKGFRELEVFSREISPLNVAFKTGVPQFYNIFTAGIGTWEGKKRWSYGYGVGSKDILSESWDFNFEYTANWVSEGKKHQGELSLLNIFDFSFEFKSRNGASISLGPSFNFWLSEWKDEETGEFLSDLAPNTLWEEGIRGTLFQIWIGGKLAVHF